MWGESKSLRWGCRSRPSPSILQRSRALVGWGGRSCEFCGSKMVFSKLGTSSSLGKKEGSIYTPPPPKNLTVGCQESPAKAGVKSGYSRSHRLKPAWNIRTGHTKAGQIAGLRQRGFHPKNCAVWLKSARGPALAGLLSQNAIWSSSRAQ
jgi:hypothetical protein